MLFRRKLLRLCGKGPVYKQLMALCVLFTFTCISFHSLLGLNSQPLPVKPLQIRNADEEYGLQDDLFKAAEMIYWMLRQTNEETMSIYRFIVKLQQIYVKSRSSAPNQFEFLPYGLNNYAHLKEVLQAAKLLFSESEQGGLGIYRVDQIYHHQKILHTRVLPSVSRPDSCNNCMVSNFDYLITPQQVCNGGGRISIILLTTSVPKNTEARAVVRRSWGGFNRHNSRPVRNIFLFGSEWPREDTILLHEEALRYGDILQGDFPDNYYNRVYKILMGFRWAVAECAQAQFIMRTADDAYIHVERVLNLIRIHGNEKRFQQSQIGMCHGHSKLHRFMDSKDYVSMMEYPKLELPPYAQGPNSLTSTELTRLIVNASSHVPFLFLDDGYIGLVLLAINRSCYDIPQFVRLHFSEATGYFLLSCNLAYWYTHHSLNPEGIARIHNYCELLDHSAHAFLYIVFVVLILMLLILRFRRFKA